MYRWLIKVKEFGFGGVRITEKLVEMNLDMKWKLGLCGGLWGSGYAGRYRKTELFWQFPTALAVFFGGPFRRRLPLLTLELRGRDEVLRAYGL